MLILGTIIRETEEAEGVRKDWERNRSSFCRKVDRRCEKTEKRKRRNGKLRKKK